jgi:drug/metabolite transporter (DMT)-like permease
MLKGAMCAIGACFIWGLAFVIPLFMENFSSVEVTLGRYLFYGLISCVILLKSWFRQTYRYSLSMWSKAIFFAFIGSVGYYYFVVLSVRYSNSAICALISGITPISIALYGNLTERKVNFRELIIPSLLILLGLVIINAPYLTIEGPITFHLIGVTCAFIALASWTWYAVSNAHFLKSHPEVDSGEWATLVGVATFFLTALAIGLMSLFSSEQLSFAKYTVWTPELAKFIIGSLVLGILCSWVGTLLWNIASVHLSVLLASQIIIFETLFGLMFAYLVEMRFPSVMETLGTVLLLAAIIYGWQAFSKEPLQEASV